MTVLYSNNYAPNAGEMPVTHSRIVHSGIWQAGTASASSEEVGHEADNANHSETYEWWTPSAYASGVAYWQLTFDTESEFDSVCIGAHNLGECESSVTIQANVGGLWVDVVADRAITDDSPIMAIFARVTATGVRLYITEPAGAVVARVGVVRAARAMQMPRMIYQSASPSRFNRNVERITNRSASNEMLGTHVVRKSLEAEYSWSNVPQDFVYGQWHDFMKAGDVEAAFIAWRPDPLRPYYGDVDYMLEPNFTAPSFSGPQYMSIGVSGSVRAWE